MKNTILILSVAIMHFSLYSQKLGTQLEYGGAFVAYGDLQSNYISVGLSYDLGYNLLLGASYWSTGMINGGGYGGFRDSNFFGIDKTRQESRNIFSTVKESNDLYNKTINIGSRQYIPVYNINNCSAFNLSLDWQLAKFNKTKIIVGGITSLLNMEILQPAVGQSADVYPAKPNLPPAYSDYIEVSAQYHFLDWGVGYELGLDRELSDRINLGARGRYIQYFHGAQNMVFWNFTFGFKLL